MSTRIATLAAAVVLGVTSVSSAMAYDHPTRYMGFANDIETNDIETTGTVYAAPSRSPYSCPVSSAAEGNANQQNFPVKQYGQTSGGNRC